MTAYRSTNISFRIPGLFLVISTFIFALCQFFAGTSTEGGYGAEINWLMRSTFIIDILVISLLLISSVIGTDQKTEYIAESM